MRNLKNFNNSLDPIWFLFLKFLLTLEIHIRYICTLQSWDSKEHSGLEADFCKLFAYRGDLKMDWRMELNEEKKVQD